MRQGGQSCLLHCFEWECDTVLENGKSDACQKMGIEDFEIDIQTGNDGKRRLVEYKKTTMLRTYGSPWSGLLTTATIPL